MRVKGGGGEGWGRTPLGDGPYPHSRAPGRHKQNRILYYSIFLSHIKKEKKKRSVWRLNLFIRVFKKIFLISQGKLSEFRTIIYCE